jgi:hypothetical protein
LRVVSSRDAADIAAASFARRKTKIDERRRRV